MVFSEKDFYKNLVTYRGFPSGSAVENLPAVQESGFSPWSGRSPEEGMAAHSSILAWRIPWSREPGGATALRVAKS